jgi:hypothetical protein
VQASKTRSKAFIFAAILGIAAPLASPTFAHGAKHGASASGSRSSHFVARAGGAHGSVRMARFHGGARVRLASYSQSFGSVGGGYLNCVAFAKQETGIDLSGNASTWWGHAAGLYERGSRPEVGAIMSFQSNGRMPSGHVAVVASVVNSREVVIDHANWGGPGAMRGGVSRGIHVIDVSPSNDWTAVRVALGQSSEFGSVYPTNGFIYDRADDGRRLAPKATDAAMPLMNPAPRDLRSPAQREAALHQARYEEVAEAPEPRVTR